MIHAPWTKEQAEQWAAELKDKIENECRERFRLECEPPCDSYGVCENCCEITLIRVGAELAVKYTLAKAAEMIEACPTVYGNEVGGWTSSMYQPGLLYTHKARLVCPQPIEEAADGE